MKIAISGKGGVGKTLLSALLSKTFAEAGFTVLAIDADPVSTLAATLGIPDADKITPISRMADLIEERTGAKPGKTGSFFRLNPRVDDLPEKFSIKYNGIRFMLMGAIKKGGSGCYCPENVMLGALISHLLLQRDEVVIIDMEAGIEHLGRATSKAVDKLIVVVEPGRRSIEAAYSIKQLAQDIGVNNIAIVGNKVHDESEKQFMLSSLPGFEFLGFIPYDKALTEADIAGRPVLEASQPIRDAVKGIYQVLVSGAPVKSQAK
ncbi:MAG: carbon monoxide dehydrogenase accessory protein CooC [Dehalococcoidales bacterium]|nr:carbon monoxide dehydrogenase accessory protein CooC [Dehalococcoidales bacterium]